MGKGSDRIAGMVERECESAATGRAARARRPRCRTGRRRRVMDVGEGRSVCLSGELGEEGRERVVGEAREKGS